ncbi:MAG TPA: DUF6600 domain-containing protein [Verrucomicrobiae bacterium]|nr:DUF6600 domain-containing protein [Verrucomicrobiae bacterium]
MKKCLVSYLALGFSLVALLFLSSGSRQNASSASANPLVASASADIVTAERSDDAAATQATTNAAVAGTEAMTDLAGTNAPAVVQTNGAMASQTNAVLLGEATVEQTPPTNLHLSPVLSEAVKIVQSGVDQSVLYTFITNTTGYFALGADEIVYLNDLGVDGNVITAMMEHDKALRELRANAWQAYAASNQMAQLPQPEQSEPETAAAPSYVEPPPLEAEPVYASDNYFYDTLSPYGTWVYVPGYGSCWRPTAAICNPGWRPYVDRGRWVYSDCGWYWLSDYTWGATTFHYGRWFNDARFGWCWWPDTVWAPSWVSWRYTSDYCGWAPIPPNCYYRPGFGLVYTSGSVGASFGFGLGYSSYAFVPWGSFCSPRPYQYCLPASTAIHVYNKSRPYNHWEGGGKGRAFNRGLAPDRVRDFSRTEVRRVSINEQAGRSRRAERIERDGRTLTVNRPQFASTQTDIAGAAPARRQAVTSRTAETALSVPQRPVAPAISTLSPSTTAPSMTERPDARPQRDQVAAPVRPAVRPSAPVSRVDGSRVEAKPPVPAAPRRENRENRENRADQEVENQAARPPSRSPIMARPTEPPAARIAEVNQRTLIDNRASEPRVIQPSRQTAARPSAPAQRSSIVVIGNGSNNRSGGRDYSVWSTPSRQPAPDPAPASPPRADVSSRNSQPAPVSTPTVADSSPAQGNLAQNDNGPGRPAFRGASQNHSAAPAAPARPATTPSPRPTPQPSYNARPTMPAPAQNHSVRSQPSAPQPSASPSATRVESRPAPAQSRPSAPANSSAGSSQGRPRR